MSRIWLWLSLLPALAQADTVLPSPDGKWQARFIEAPARGAGLGELRLEINDKDGQRRLRRDYRSVSGMHGYALAKAQWTPDSQFLVYTLQSSGGHQPWRFPLYVYSVRHTKLVDLERKLGPVTSPALAMQAPNTLAVQHLDKQTQADRVTSLKLDQIIK